MINSTQSPQGTQVNQTKPAFAPSYNAVQINLDTPTLNAPPAGYYYDYPQAEGQPYYPPAQPAPQQPAGPAVPPPVPQAPVDQAPAPAQPMPQQPAAKEDFVNQVLANLSDPDYDKQLAQLKEIGEKSMIDEAQVIPYIEPPIIDKIEDIISFDSSQLPGPTDRQIQLRPLVDQNDEVKRQAEEQARAQGIDPKTIQVQLPNQISAEDEALARQLTPQDHAEKNKAFALLALSALQNAFIDKMIANSEPHVPPAITDVPGMAQVVEEIKNNPNPSIRLAALEALNRINRPEYAQEVATVDQIAQSDENQMVAGAATKFLNDMMAPQPQEMQQAQPQPAQA